MEGSVSDTRHSDVTVEERTVLANVTTTIRTKPGEKWMSSEVHTIPHNNLKIVFPSILLTVFLASVDQTITAVALPTIVKELGGQSGYSWVGTAYMLASACASPLNGKLSDMFGRKPVYFTSIFLFILGSALCGAAQTFLWLVLARGVQGAGGGGLVQLSMTTISDIVPIDKRGYFLGFHGTTWTIASVFGPLVGGVLTDHVSWRWCFWINIPTGALSGVLLFMFLRLNPTPRLPVHQLIREFDFAGLASLASGIACLLVGFNNGEASWSSSSTIALVAVGVGLLILGSVNEMYTSRSPIIPPRLFKTRTTAGILFSSFVLTLACFSLEYYMPVYFQILGANATMAGIKLMPYSVASSFFSAVIGVYMTRIGYRRIIWASWAITTVGFGLATILDSNSNTTLQEMVLLVTALGMAGLFQVPLVALQAAMPLRDMATSTAVFSLIRTLGATIGISIGGAIYGSEVHRRLERISDYHPPTGSHLTNDVRALVDIQPSVVRDAVLHAYSRSISSIWIVVTPLIGLAFLSVLPIRSYSFDRTIVLAGAPTADRQRVLNEDSQSEGDVREKQNVPTA